MIFARLTSLGALEGCDRLLGASLTAAGHVAPFDEGMIMGAVVAVVAAIGVYAAWRAARA